MLQGGGNMEDTVTALNGMLKLIWIVNVSLKQH